MLKHCLHKHRVRTASAHSPLLPMDIRYGRLLHMFRTMCTICNKTPVCEITWGSLGLLACSLFQSIVHSGARQPTGKVLLQVQAAI